jgi:hypothetical protein
LATSDDLATDRERFDARMENIFRDQTSPEGTSLNVIEIQGMNTHLMDGIRGGGRGSNTNSQPRHKDAYNEELSASGERQMMKHSSLMPKASEPESPTSSAPQKYRGRGKSHMYALAKSDLRLNQES